MAKTTDALTILDQRIGNDADLRQMIAGETLKAQIGPPAANAGISHMFHIPVDAAGGPDRADDL
jgi:hypothetical protein